MPSGVWGFLLAFVVQMLFGFSLALPLLWLGGLAGVCFAVATIIAARQMRQLGTGKRVQRSCART